MGNVLLPQTTNWHCRLTRHFQAKMLELIVGLDYLCKYLDDLLCITKAKLNDHLQKLRKVLTRFQDTGLKLNAWISKFCATEMKYLGYVITTSGIKPQQQKVQAILSLTPPIHFCMEMWVMEIIFSHHLFQNIFHLMIQIIFFICMETWVKRINFL